MEFHFYQTGPAKTRAGGLFPPALHYNDTKQIDLAFHVGGGWLHLTTDADEYHIHTVFEGYNM